MLFFPIFSIFPEHGQWALAKLGNGCLFLCLCCWLCLKCFQNSPFFWFPKDPKWSNKMKRKDQELKWEALGESLLNFGDATQTFSTCFITCYYLLTEYFIFQVDNVCENPYRLQNTTILLVNKYLFHWKGKVRENGGNMGRDLGIRSTVVTASTEGVYDCWNILLVFTVPGHTVERK